MDRLGAVIGCYEIIQRLVEHVGRSPDRWARLLSGLRLMASTFAQRTQAD
jgi:hypothetical protein